MSGFADVKGFGPLGEEGGSLELGPRNRLFLQLMM